MNQPELPFEAPVTKSYPVVRLTEQAKTWVTKAIKAHAQERVVWDLSVSAFPEPSQENSYLPFLALYLEIEGAIPQTSIYGSSVIAAFQLNSGRIERVVKTALEDLRSERDKQPKS